MKELALALAAQAPDPAGRANLLREYLQAMALRSLHEAGAFNSLSFVGGTALRFLFELARFSDDLGFSVEDPVNFTPREWQARLRRDLLRQGFEAEVSWNDSRIVHVGWVRVSSLLREAGASGHPDQKLSIKLEVDTRPPAGAVCGRTVVQRHAFLPLRHHDLPSLMAGKLHAVATRDYTKGRDWYDLVWYLSRRPAVTPNQQLLRNALAQTGHANPDLPWKDLLHHAILETDMDSARRDVIRFLERPEDAELITRENLLSLLDRAG